MLHPVPELDVSASLPTPHPAPHPARQRLRAAAVLGLLASLALGGVLIHAAACRHQRPAEAAAHLRVLPSTALVLSTRSRWLRHPALSEPGAAFSEGPAFPDADPAGALQSPPIALHRAAGAAPYAEGGAP